MPTEIYSHECCHLFIVRNLIMLELAPLSLRDSPEIALFLSLLCGYAIGRIRFGPVQLGGVCGTLLAALLIGNLAPIVPSPAVKSFFFALFIFALGYAGGPQFFANLNAKGLRLGGFCLIEVSVVLMLVMLATWLFHLDQGTAAGLMAGSATESAVVGTAADAISKLPLDQAAIDTLQANVVTAYSITYVFGLVTIVVATSQFFPLLLKVNLRQEAEDLWQKMGGSETASSGVSQKALSDVIGNIYRVEKDSVFTVGDLEAAGDYVINVEKLKRHGKLIEATDGQGFQIGDLVLLTGRRENVLRCGELLGSEVDYVSGLNFVVEIRDVVFNRRDMIGATLTEIRRRVRKSGWADSVFLLAVIRQGTPLPLLPDLQLQQGDVIRLQGPPRDIVRVSDQVGKPLSSANETDLFFAGMGIVLGILVGGLGVKLGGVTFSLGTGGGALLSGLLFGWLQSLRPGIGHIPASAIELMKDLGLAMFIACVGLSSGPQAMALIKNYGVALPLMGILIALLPAVLSLLFGRFVLKLESPVLLGAIAGQQCSTPALSAVVNVAGNSTPLLGYTITYAISNIVLPLLGPLIVFMAGQIVPH